MSELTQEEEEELKRLLEKSGGAPLRHQSIAGLDRSAAAQAEGNAAAASGQGNVAQAAKNMVNIFTPAKISGDEAHALADYLHVLSTGCQGIPLLSINPDEANVESRGGQPELQQVYIGLNVVDPRPTDDEDEVRAKEEMQSLKMERERDEVWSALEACRHYPQAVLLGDPGAGKSTFLKMLALALAADFYTDCEEDQAPNFGEPLIPIFVVLRDFAAADLVEPEPKPAVRLPRYIKNQLEADDLGAAYPVLERFWRDGKAILMLDGLDEIATSEKRDYVLDSILQFFRLHQKQGTRILVTCRVAAYQRLGDEGETAADWRLPTNDFPSLTLAPFNRQQMHDFIGRWYAELSAKGRLSSDPELKAERLRRALERSHIRRLAPNPLLLTVMTIVHATVGELPDQRVKLYEAAVETLLHRWRQGRDPGEIGDEPESVVAILAEEKATPTGLESRLWRLARDVHAKTPVAGDGSEDPVADILLNELVSCLRSLHQIPDTCRPWTTRLIEAIKHRSGLLVELRRDIFSFPHRTFQEYLAARDLARDSDFTRSALTLRLEPSAIWREVILMAAGTFAHIENAPSRAVPLINALIKESAVPPSTAGSQRDLVLAADLVAEMTTASLLDAEEGDRLIRNLRERLQSAMFCAELDDSARSALGSALGRVSDPRAGVAEAKSRIPQIEWSSPIPSDPFPIGSHKKSSSYEDETPGFACDLIEADYAIAIYPVTVAQYQLFIDDYGYQSGCDQFWTPDGLIWRNEREITGPETYRDVFQTPNHPQVGVSWYEALAFTNWLADRSGIGVRLPTEPEWERAARHSDARIYPWGDAESDDSEVIRCANLSGTGIGSTSPVGLFENGKAECGAFDLSGNVWEWCQSKWTEDYKSYAKDHDASPEGSSGRVLRGGAWTDLSDGARCACRFWFHPDYRSGGIGFRLCVSPFSSSGL